MVGRMSLDGTWKCKGTDGRRGEIATYCVPDVDERPFFDAQVPGEVHLDLMRLGRIQDPRVGVNALAARWVEEQIWIYRRTFTAPPEALAAKRVWLVFAELDLIAGIGLNGELVGTHENAFTPCRIDVTEHLREGDNQLSVAIEAGLYAAAERTAGDYDPRHPDSLLHKRMWLRKPQFQFGWDWNPRLVNVGISGPVALEWAETARIDQVTLYPELAEDHSTATLHVRVHAENVQDTPLEATLAVQVSGPGSASAQATVTLPPGASTQSLAIEIREPALWWPLPHGEQPLYDVACQLEVGGATVDSRQLRTGIRSIAIDRSPHPEGGEHFILVVNGEPIFAKGGNWVPADMLMADVDKERYRRLIDEAVQANCNTLRIWGGGRYVDHDLLDLCDEAGLLVWHDFIFACSQYPSGDPTFLRSVRDEITHVARELSPHPSLAVWCGNNEIEWGAWDWMYDTVRAHPDYALYHMEIPRIVRREDPSRPYWPSSPYSPDSLYPNDPTVGDQHPWHVSLGESRENFWAYRGDVSRFPNEGGALGASSIATLEQFLPADERYYLSPSWEYHDNELASGPNPQAADAPGRKSINEQWFRTWFGLDPAALSMRDYAYLSGALQAEALVEYANNFRRRMFSTASAIFWMYNDSWPATHGWTIVDYYLRRKLAYHPVRRAFDPIQIIPALDGDLVGIYGVNDTLAPWEGEAVYGWARFDGGAARRESQQVTLAPNASTLLATLPLAEWEALGYQHAAAYATLWQQGRCVRQNRLLMAPYKEIVWAQPQIRVSRQGELAVFESDVFVWAVCLDPEGESGIADDLFDLLPGIPWGIPWPQERELPAIVETGNRHFL
jgi:beta-mannosidase